MEIINEIQQYKVSPSKAIYQVIAQLITNGREIVFCVDSDDQFIGAISLGDTKRYIANGGDLAESCDSIINRNAKFLLSDALETSKKPFTKNIRCVPVLDPGKKLVGLAVGAPEAKVSEDDINLNIGSAQYHIEGFIDLDLPSDWYDKKRKADYIAFDIRNDDIPFEENRVSNIYCSHVIEHLEDDPVEFFINNCFRALKPGGVLRIACPDAEYLWQISQFDNDYWDFMQYWFDDPNNSTSASFSEVSKEDQLIRALATEKCRHYVHKKSELDPEAIKGLSYKATLEQMKKGLKYDVNFLGNHVNQWDYNRLKELGAKMGYRQVLRSKYRGSVSSIMQGEQFDQTWPTISLYVDLVK